MDSEQSIFERIMSGQIPSELLYEDDHAIVIRDINPQAPVHIDPSSKDSKAGGCRCVSPSLAGSSSFVSGENGKAIGL